MPSRARSIPAVVLTLTLSLGLLASFLGGCGTEKRVKECVARCEEAARECERRKEPECEARGRACGEGCQKL